VTVPIIHLDKLVAGYGGRGILNGLDLDVAPGEVVAILGPNGSGKTTLIKVLLGQIEPMSGVAEVNGGAPSAAIGSVGYVPQHRGFDRDLPLRGRELVELGLTGTRLGIPWPNRSVRAAVDRALASVEASHFADAPIGLLSGGEQQRLRIAQAILGDPKLLLLDEPLLALDPARQSEVVALIDAQRHRTDAAVLFVTHELNPILPIVDRVLYLVGGRAAIGTVGEVVTTESLSALYGVPVEVIEAGGRLLVIAGDEGASGLLGHHHHDHDHDHDHDAEDSHGGGPWA
jgi:zinc/manganese transport system ATP-binding protein